MSSPLIRVTKRVPPAFVISNGGPMYILHFLLHKKTLAEGDVFDIDTRCLFFGQEELPSQFECRVLENNTEVASAVLTVYRPRDLQEFVRTTFAQ